MQKALKNAVGKAVKGNAWKKIPNPSAGCGKTAFPKAQAEQERVGVQWDYDERGHQSRGNVPQVPNTAERWESPSSIKR